MTGLFKGAEDVGTAAPGGRFENHPSDGVPGVLMLGLLAEETGALDFNDDAGREGPWSGLC